MNIRIAAPVHDWRDYLPLAKEETSRFYRKQERGKFRYEDLLGVAVEALGNAAQAFDHTRNNGLAAYARKGIWGALNDYVRDACKIVSNVEMSEEEYLRTRGSPNPPPAVIRRVCVSKEGGAWHLLRCVRQTFYTPGHYRTNYQLLQGGDGYKVNSKHGKVSVAIARASYKDDWDQQIGGWIRDKIEEDPDNEEDHVPLSARLVERGAVDQSDYVGRGRQKRWSISWLNAGVVHMALPNGPLYRSPSYGRTTKILRHPNGRFVKLHDPDPAYAGPPWDDLWALRCSGNDAVITKAVARWWAFLQVVREVFGRFFAPKSVNGVRRISGAAPWRKDVLLPKKDPEEYKNFDYCYYGRRTASDCPSRLRNWSYIINHWNDDQSQHHSARGPAYLSLVRQTPGPLSWQQQTGSFDVGWGLPGFRPIRWEQVLVDGVWETYAVAADVPRSKWDDYLDRWVVEREYVKHIRARTFPAISLGTC